MAKKTQKKKIATKKTKVSKQEGKKVQNKITKKTQTKKNRSKTKIYFWLIAIAIVLMVALLTFNLIVKYKINNSKINEHYEYEMDVVVAENAGFNLDKDKIHFGKVPVNSKSSREIVMTVGTLPSKINMSVEGNISQFITIYPDDEIVLVDNAEQTIELEVYIPMDAELGRYEGKLFVDIMN